MPNTAIKQDSRLPEQGDYGSAANDALWMTETGVNGAVNGKKDDKSFSQKILQFPGNQHIAPETQARPGNGEGSTDKNPRSTDKNPSLQLPSALEEYLGKFRAALGIGPPDDMAIVRDATRLMTLAKKARME